MLFASADVPGKGSPISAVEADRSRSNQHEFNGTAPLRGAFGKYQRRIPTDFVRMADDGSWISASSDLTWYDARAMHPTRTEYRLYYRNNAVTTLTAEGDVLVLSLRSDDTALALVAPGSGLAAARIFWLFGIEIAPGAGFAALDLDPEAQQGIATRLGLGSHQAADAWSSDDPVRVSLGDATLRDETSRLQQLIGTVTKSNADPGLDDWFPEQVPAALGGEGMGQTIRGILAPRSGQ
ncbi:MAG: hypothetical protein ACREB7_07095 [Sphingopyxis sp.]|uniref:hypothetical protein n=1 Tax=Sphingopyxis sp. TaxID=1908224 RepID=UPI003D6CA584